MKYDYFIAGRWRNHQVIREILQAVRTAGKTAYCFIENAYDGDNIAIDAAPGADAESFMTNLETIADWQHNPTFKKIYDNDMEGLKNSKELVMVFPAGLSAHMELGTAFGMGKKCYAIGQPEKHETLYLMLETIYPNVTEFLAANVGVAV